MNPTLRVLDRKVIGVIVNDWKKSSRILELRALLSIPLFVVIFVLYVAVLLIPLILASGRWVTSETIIGALGLFALFVAALLARAGVRDFWLNRDLKRSRTIAIAEVQFATEHQHSRGGNDRNELKQLPVGLELLLLYHKVPDTAYGTTNIESFSFSDDSYLVSLDDQTCTCPDFLETARAEVPKDHFGRWCKHLVRELSQHGAFVDASDWHSAIVKEAYGGPDNGQLYT